MNLFNTKMMTQTKIWLLEYEIDNKNFLQSLGIFSFLIFLLYAACLNFTQSICKTKYIV